MSDWCLGLKFLEKCSYNPAQPEWKIISLGEGIAVISIILAFSQLLTLTMKFRVKKSLVWMYWLWLFAIFSIGVASVLPLIPGKAVPLIGYPIFWEFVGAILLTAGLIYLLWNFNRRLKFSVRTGEDIRRLIANVIATGEQKDCVELSQALRAILPDLVKSMKQFNSLEAEIARREKREYHYPDHCTHSSQILQICSDPFFCSVIVRKDPGFAIELFKQIQLEDAYSNRFANPLVRELIKQSIVNCDSILHRESSLTGLGYASEFTKACFTCHKFNEEMTILSGVSLISSDKVPIDVLEKFADILEIILEAYLSNRDFYVRSYCLLTSYSALCDYGGYVSLRIDHSTPQELYKSFEYEVLNIVVKTLTDGLKLLAKHSEKFDPKLIYYWSTLDSGNDYSVFEIFADLIFEFIEHTSHTRKYDVEMRDLLISLWMEVFPISEDRNTVVHVEIQRRLISKLEAQVDFNLDKGLYPAVTRPLMTVLGLHHGKDDATDQTFRSIFLKKLTEKFSDLYDRDPERALDKLAVNVSYDADQKTFTQNLRRGESRSLKCS